jgi:hypothetical protein
VVDKIAVKGRNTGVTVFEPLCSLGDVSGEKYYSLIDLCAKSRDAFNFYQDKRFSKAIELYSAILKIFPWVQVSVDPILKNCKQFVDGVPDYWDGINHLVGK